MAIQGDPKVLILCGIIFLLSGILVSIKPNWLIKCQIWQTRVFMGAKYTPTKRTIVIVRGIGYFFIVLGLFLLALYFWIL